MRRPYWLACNALLRGRPGLAGDRGQSLMDYVLLSALVVLVLYIATGPLSEYARPIVEALADELENPLE